MTISPAGQLYREPHSVLQQSPGSEAGATLEMPLRSVPAFALAGFTVSATKKEKRKATMALTIRICI
ncbi:hypothetical protein [Cryptosporangium sp. NPDC051539]|uniref:hypothetical protein n=1 Tax=Cryptosporangium sp. NPDC051539 TaxID=3363962 RepID=UPI0037B17C68